MMPDLAKVDLGGNFGNPIMSEKNTKIIGVKLYSKSILTYNTDITNW